MSEAKFLVIGNVLDEVITRSSDGFTREHVGGVGAIMARELARAGADVTILSTSLSHTIPHYVKWFEQYGVKLMLTVGNPRQSQQGYAVATARLGQLQYTRSSFPDMGGIALELYEMAGKFDWVLTDVTLMPDELLLLSRLAKNLLVNPNASSVAKRVYVVLKERQGNDGGQTVLCMNEHEANILCYEAGVIGVQQLVNQFACRMMVTMEGNGRVLYLPFDQPRHRSAPSVPEGADFCGAGDSIAAGMAYALSRNLSINHTAGEFVERLMRFNAQSYKEVKDDSEG